MIAANMTASPKAAKAAKATKPAKSKAKAGETFEQAFRRKKAEAKKEFLESEYLLGKLSDLIEAAKSARSAADDIAFMLHQRNHDGPPPDSGLTNILIVENADFYRQVTAFQATAETVLDWVRRAIPSDVILAATGDDPFSEWD